MAERNFWTRMKTGHSPQRSEQAAESEASGLSQECRDCRVHLGSYLDNDLRGSEATSVAAHLNACDSCQKEHAGLLSVRTALRRLADPKNSDVVRDRVFVRLERAARLAEAAEVQKSQRRTVLHGWRIAVGSLAAAGMVLTGIVTLLPVGTNHGQETNGKSVPGAAASVALPAPAQMTALLEFHDARTATVAQTPAVNGSSSDENTDKSSGAVAGSAGIDSVSDEVPEAI